MENTPKCAVLFDMDGVLIDSYEAWFGLMNAAAKDFGYPPITREQFASIWGQGPDLDVELFFRRHTVEEVETYYNRHFHDYSKRVRVNSSAIEVFEALHRDDIGVAVITNTPSTIARDVLGVAELTPDVLVGGTDVARGKPAPDMVFKALETLGVAKEQALFVGDSHFDEEAAAAAGVRYIHYDIKENEPLDVVLGALSSL
jgi:HAD superfamily hydrolase (TIGR01509 family)